MIILVDYENTHQSGMEGYWYLNETDTLVLYYSDSKSAMPKGCAEKLKKAGVKVSLVRLKTKRDNALDMYIAASTGLYATGGEKICIVSKDKGYQAVRDFWRMMRGTEILLGETIENCLLHSIDSEDPRIQMVRERHQKVNLIEQFEHMKAVHMAEDKKENSVVETVEESSFSETVKSVIEPEQQKTEDETVAENIRTEESGKKRRKNRRKNKDSLSANETEAAEQPEGQDQEVQTESQREEPVSVSEVKVDEDPINAEQMTFISDVQGGEELKKTAKKKNGRSRKKTEQKEAVSENLQPSEAEGEVQAEESKPKRSRRSRSKKSGSNPSEQTDISA